MKRAIAGIVVIAGLLLSACEQPGPPAAVATTVPTAARYDDLVTLAEQFAGANTDWTPQAWVFGDDPTATAMVLVPVGCFTMGSADGQDDELPTAVQCIAAPYWIDLTEVTNAAFGDTGCERYSSGPNAARDCTTWLDARDYCAARGARLPTELEWEYAARGPSGWAYPWGDDWDPTKAVWVGDWSGSVADVGSRPAGASWVGALDMSGNVWEWVSTQYAAYPYSASDGREVDDSFSRRVLRGGSFASSPFELRASDRGTRSPDEAFAKFDAFGFRCARDS